MSEDKNGEPFPLFHMNVSLTDVGITKPVCGFTEMFSAFPQAREANKL